VCAWSSLDRYGWAVSKHVLQYLSGEPGSRGADGERGGGGGDGERKEREGGERKDDSREKEEKAHQTG
jgi:hypothetical protein